MAKSKNKKVAITIRIDEKVKDSFDKYCEEKGLFKNRFVEKALIAELNKRKEEKAIIENDTK